MHIPISVILPFFVLSFILLAFQYYRISPDRRILNLQFGMMLGSLVLLLALVGYPQWSVFFLPLGLLWFGATLALMRTLPPPRH